MHILTRPLVDRLDVRARQNVSSVVRYAGATGVLVARARGAATNGRVRALVLTNFHVAGDERFRDDVELTFADGSVGHPIRVVAARRDLDYALVEVELPASASVSTPQPRAGRAGPGEAIYAISADAHFGFDEPSRRFVARSPAPRTSNVWQTSTGVGTIQLGRMASGETVEVQATGPTGGSLRVARSALPNTAGTSGSPVFSREHHDLVALHSAGSAGHALPTAPATARVPWESSEVPIDEVTADIERARARAELPTESRELVDQFLRARGAP